MISSSLLIIAAAWLVLGFGETGSELNILAPVKQPESNYIILYGTILWELNAGLSLAAIAKWA